MGARASSSAAASKRVAAGKAARQKAAAAEQVDEQKDMQATTRPVGGLRRVFVKIGTHTLSNPDGMPDGQLLDALGSDIHGLMSQGKRFVVVSSGAIGCGRAALKAADEPSDVELRQAYAAIGQPRLMEIWRDSLARHKVPVAQVLPTHQSFESRRAFLHLKACIDNVQKLGVVAIVNENDSVSVREIGPDFGDNDRLGVLMATRLGADLYVILSDVQGLFDRPPHEEGAKLVPRVPRIDNKILALAGPAKNGHAGGMRNKLEAARQLTESGIHVVIAYGREDHVLERILAGEDIGTWFDAVATNKDDASWLAQASPAGSIQLDAGAAAAVRAGNNLLLAGVVGVEGDFPVDSVVDLTHAGKAVARAVCRYASADLLRCRGLQTEAARAVLGFEGGMNVAQKEATLLL